MNNTTFSHVPPGFRFHPTDEELVDYYLRKKVASKKIDLDVIKDVDLYKIEPWDLQELCRIGTEEQNEWYFFSHKDKKYPTGTRTNRATKAGFWKATGRDKGIYSRHSLIGMRKTLVFYKGRAPNGQKSDWIMHEYRLETNENGPPQEEGWVVCRVFKKRLPTIRKLGEYDSPCWYNDQVSYMAPELDSPPGRIPQHYSPYLHHYPCKQELDQLQYNLPHHHDPNNFLQLPPLESPKVPQHSGASTNCTSTAPYGYDSNSSGSTFPSSSSALTQEIMIQQTHLPDAVSLCNNSHNNIEQSPMEQLTDWRVLDKFVASQLSHDQDVSKVANYNSSSAPFNVAELLGDESKRSAIEEELSSRSCQIDLWK